ncbi:MAG: 16S rRNA (guanine(966)-N(2))-methyltransferase RsmD [Lachnospiraceae bacterium]
MRIIAGKARSLPLKTIEGFDTRPTTDRIKETLFNIIQNQIPGATFLDLFSGSGAIGLEAISRGAHQAYFVENNKKAADCIAENIHFTKFDKQCTLMCMDVLAALKKLEGTVTFDVVFMDPPYQKLHEKNVIAYLKDSTLINEDTLIIVEASLDTTFEYLEEYGFEATKLKQYKTNQHVFIYRKECSGI